MPLANFDLSGRVAIVTGGSRGLGRIMGLAFAEHGANVVVASRKLEQCESTAAEIEKHGVRALPVACHVGHWGQIDDLVEKTYAEFGRLDIVVNNAGMSPLYPRLDELEEALFDKVVDVNFKGPFRLSAVAGMRMKAAGKGSIINISSIAAVTPSPQAEPYGGAKAALNTITRSFCYALSPEVRVNAIMAGPFLTDISKAWDMEKFNDRAQTAIPLRRGGEPEEVAGAAVYLASDASSYTTGAIIPIDGGCQGQRTVE